MEKFGLKHHLNCSSSLLAPECLVLTDGKESSSNPSSWAWGSKSQGFGGCSCHHGCSWLSLFSKPRGPHVFPSHVPFPAINQKPNYHHSTHITTENVKTQLTFGNLAQADTAELPAA